MPPDSIRHVILDRDGVLNAERDDGGCIEDWAQWRWIAGALQALQRLHGMGTKVSVVTNQSGVGRGRITRARVDALHARLVAEVARHGGGIDAVLVCPHAPEDGCKCRKPAPGLVLQAVAHSRVRAGATVLVGDDLRDLDAAAAAGVRPVLVRTGKGRSVEAVAAARRIAVFDDLYAFVLQLETAVQPAPGEPA